MNQEWYDHLTVGKIKYGDLSYLFLDCCETITQQTRRLSNESGFIRLLRHFGEQHSQFEELLQAAVVQR